MGFKSDIEIAQEAQPQDIRDIAKKLGLTEDDIELYGKYKAIKIKKLWGGFNYGIQI